MQFNTALYLYHGFILHYQEGQGYCAGMSYHNTAMTSGCMILKELCAAMAHLFSSFMHDLKDQILVSPAIFQRF